MQVFAVPRTSANYIKLKKSFNRSSIFVSIINNRQFPLKQNVGATKPTVLNKVEKFQAEIKNICEPLVDVGLKFINVME